jgi:hypothetical protein
MMSMEYYTQWPSFPKRHSPTEENYKIYDPELGLIVKV